MAVGKPSTSTTTRYDKEIDALLNRLHSGCRFIDFNEDNVNVATTISGDGRGKRASAVSNFLRNISPPDETHAELGRALAHSYLGSLKSISSSLKSNGDDVQSAIDRGEFIIHSICCGENINGSSRHQQQNQFTQNHVMGRENYASVGYSFFNGLQSFFVDDGNKRNGDDDDDDDGVKKFLQYQWQKWCVRCEELVLPSSDNDMPSLGCCNGGGRHVLNACLKCYGYVMCYFEGHTSNNSISAVYTSLANHSSRMYLIRTYINHAVCFMQSNCSVEFVGRISPLFDPCVLSSRKTPTTNQSVQAERRLIVQELLRGCATVLSTNDMSSILICEQIANLVQYLTESLTSYLKQCIHANFTKLSGDNNQITDMSELSYDWLRGICDLMSRLVLMMKTDNTTVLSSMKEIITIILPQFTNSVDAVSYDMSQIYALLIKCMNSLPCEKLFPLANPIVALRLSSLALNLPDGAEVKLLLELILSIYKCLDNTSEDYGPNSSIMLTGGVLSSLGCVFRCRPSCIDSATQLSQLGESILQNGQNGETIRKHEYEGFHLVDIIVNSMDGEDIHPLLDIISSSISDAGTPSMPFNNWHRRPLSSSDQSSGLLLGLSLLHMSLASSQTGVNPNNALDFLQAFLQCYPRLSSRAIPSIIDITRCHLDMKSTSSINISTALEFLSAPCVVSDPHGASLTWTFMSSLTKEGVPTAVRSTVIRLLPRMCSSNKKLFRRVMSVIGKTMVAQ